MTLVGGLPEVRGGAILVQRHAFALGVGHAEFEAGLGVAALGGPHQFLNRHGRCGRAANDLRQDEKTENAPSAGVSFLTLF